MAELAMADRDYAPPRARDFSREYAVERGGSVRAAGRSAERFTGRPASRAASGKAGGASRRADGGPRPAAAIASALLAIAALVGAAAIALPRTEVRALAVSGAVTIGERELYAWSGLSPSEHWFSVDREAVAACLSAHPRVAAVTVETRFPDTVAVAVVERRPIAVVYARGESGRTEAHCVDSEGVVFAPASMYEGSSALPVLSGVEIRGLSYGLRLGYPFSELLSSLAEVAEASPALVSAISELRVVSKPGLPAELLLYPTDYRVPVRMRPVLNAGLLKSMMLVLDVVEGEGLSPGIRELDLRTDTFVYRTKEAVSG
ncbi:MAG TPA: FtsQ-type POTRA domain-containing protein [Spirochaetia bacterium]|nr:FtsQ-type POTRA domain-containing protein [Spirochaetales bacterium]HRW23946.1 FtsQ-type POTRA domain-containing protein [Spirochaetia bacterium]